MKESSYPKPSIDQVLKNAFMYWKKTLPYQILYGVLFLSIFMSVFLHFANQLGILDQYILVFEKSTKGMVLMNELSEISKSPEFAKLQYIQWGLLTMLFPLQIGFFKIFRKIDQGQKYGIQDFLSGYTGVNFFIYVSFYLFWYIINGYAMSTIILGVVWVFITIFSTPLMFFQNKRIFESISMNFKVLKQHFILVFVGVLVAFLFKLVVSFTIIGVPFVMAFGNAMIYAMYQVTLSKYEKTS